MTGFTLVLAVVLVAFGCAVQAAPATGPSTQPTPFAMARAQKLQAGVATFTLALDYHGDQDKPFYTLLLSVPEMPAIPGAANPFRRRAQITQAQAKLIIDALAEGGFLDAAMDGNRLRGKAPPREAYYSLIVSVQNGEEVVQFEEWLTLGEGLLRRLDGLAPAMEGEAGKAMELVLGRLSGYRRALAKEPGLEIRCDRAGDTVVGEVDGGRTVLTVSSPRGIGGATIGRGGEKWPQTLVLRLRLKGLESLTISSGDLTLHASVSSRPVSVKPLQTMELTQKGKEAEALAADSPFWAAIAWHGDEARRGADAAAQEGYLEMRIPPALLEANDAAMQIRWIDFHR